MAGHRGEGRGIEAQTRSRCHASRGPARRAAAPWNRRRDRSCVVSRTSQPVSLVIGVSATGARLGLRGHAERRRVEVVAAALVAADQTRGAEGAHAARPDLELGVERAARGLLVLQALEVAEVERAAGGQPRRANRQQRPQRQRGRVGEVLRAAAASRCRHSNRGRCLGCVSLGRAGADRSGPASQVGSLPGPAPLRGRRHSSTARAVVESLVIMPVTVASLRSVWNVGVGCPLVHASV